MLGSKNNFFKKTAIELFEDRDGIAHLLRLKGYSQSEIKIYIDAYNYFWHNPTAFDGATIVKDLCDIPGLDLDAMLHDYHYIKHRVASNFVTKWKADWLFAKGNERKGKGQYSAFSRFIALTIIGIGFVPYVRIKRGKITKTQKTEFLKEYQLLIK